MRLACFLSSCMLLRSFSSSCAFSSPAPSSPFRCYSLWVPVTGTRRELATSSYVLCAAGVARSAAAAARSQQERFNIFRFSIGHIRLRTEVRLLGGPARARTSAPCFFQNFSSVSPSSMHARSSFAGFTSIDSRVSLTLSKPGPLSAQCMGPPLCLGKATETCHQSSPTFNSIMMRTYHISHPSY